MPINNPFEHLGRILVDNPYVVPRPPYDRTSEYGLQSDDKTFLLDNKVYKTFNQSYSFKDAEVHAICPWHRKDDGAFIPIKLHTLSLISMSTHRDTYPVTSLGGFGIKGYTKGQGIASGALGFVRGKINGWQDVVRSLADYLDRPLDVASFTPDQLPPFDILLSIINDYGYVYTYIFRGVTIISGMTTLSTEDIGAVEMYSYMCKQILTKTSTN